MRRADRLFEIVQLLRGQRLRTAQAIADRLEVSVRTIYRDIEALIATGVPIEGERGIGYVIRSHFVLPPLQFSTEELQALVLGARFVRAWGDSALIQAAEEALVKIDAVLPAEIRGQIWRQDLTAHANAMTQAHRRTLADLRQALNRQLKVDLIYYDAKGDATARSIRPLSLDAWGHAWTLTAWCELRADFRVFRLDRIETAAVSEQGFRLEPGKTLNDFFARLSAEGIPRRTSQGATGPASPESEREI
jgi:predicted DNA-binding transcriptional regulator YafY